MSRVLGRAGGHPCPGEPDRANSLSQPNTGCWESPCHLRMGLGIEEGGHIQRPITCVLWLVELLRAPLAFGVGLVLGAATRVCLPTLS